MKKQMTLLASLGFSLSASALQPGDDVTLEAIAGADFVQGSAPESWQEGQLYVIECWATWCGPCIAAIPHVDELYDTYHEKGLNVIGMNVWEDGRDKVADFVTKKGDGMSYPVAYVGKGGAFEESWLVEGGVKGIPHAFLVKDGKLLFSTHPATLDAETIEKLIAGGPEAEAVIESTRQKEKNATALRDVFMTFSQASRDGKVEEMEASIAKVRELDPENNRLGLMELELTVAKKDWAKAGEKLAAMDSNTATMAAANFAQRLDSPEEEAPAEFLEVVAGKLASAEQPHAMLKALEARMNHRAGKLDAAKANAKELLELRGDLPAEPFEAFAASLETENPQTFGDLMKAVNEARQAAQKAAAEAPKTPAEEAVKEVE